MKKNKAQEKKDKQVLQQQKSNIIRDRKGRPFYVSENNETYYRLSQSVEKNLYIYDSRIIFAILPIMLTDLLAKKYIYFGLVLSIVIHVGFEFFYRSLIGQLNVSTNTPQEVVDQYHSVKVLKAKRSDLMMKTLLGVVISFMIMMNPNAFDFLAKTGPLRFIGNIVPYLTMALTLLPVSDLITVSGKLRKAKKNK